MRIAWIVLAVVATTVGAQTPATYDEANEIWEKTRVKVEYQPYANEFAGFNNHFGLDSRDGCYALDGKPVNLFLLIVHRGKNQSAFVEQVFADVESAKAKCFQKTYRGISTKVPPFFPFVLQMEMR